MKRSQIFMAEPFEWKRGRTHGQTARFGNPSPAAQQVWSYLIAMGKYRSQRPDAWRVMSRAAGWVLHYVRRGTFWQKTRQRRLHLAQGDICLLDRSDLPESGHDRPVSLWWIYFNGPLLPQMLSALDVHADPVFRNVDLVLVERLFRELWALAPSQTPAHEAQTNALLAALVAELFRSRARRLAIPAAIFARARLSRKIRMGIDFVSRDYYRDIGVKHIAAAAGLNVSYFSRRFHRETGLTAIAYLNRFRVQHARQLLVSTDRTVAEIARLAGFQDAKYFARVYRAATGHSPRAARQQR
jgi:AraC-like DNA-binding protein